MAMFLSNGHRGLFPWG